MGRKVLMMNRTNFAPHQGEFSPTLCCWYTRLCLVCRSVPPACQQSRHCCSLHQDTSTHQLTRQQGTWGTTGGLPLQPGELWYTGELLYSWAVIRRWAAIHKWAVLYRWTVIYRWADIHRWAVIVALASNNIRTEPAVFPAFSTSSIIAPQRISSCRQPSRPWKAA